MLSLIILIPNLPIWVTMFIRLFGALMMMGIGFGLRDKRKFIRLTLVFYLVGMVFSGVAYLFTQLCKPEFAVMNNTIIYLDFSLFTLVISTIVAYIFIYIFRRFIDKRVCENKNCSIIICNKGEMAEIDGLLDTGNSMVDSFSGKPVIVCCNNKIRNIIPEKVAKYFALNDKTDDYTIIKGVRLIPFSTVNGGGLIPAFKPDIIYIKDSETQKLTPVDAIIGVSNWEMERAIVNPDIFL